MKPEYPEKTINSQSCKHFQRGISELKYKPTTPDSHSHSYRHFSAINHPSELVYPDLIVNLFLLRKRLGVRREKFLLFLCVEPLQGRCVSFWCCKAPYALKITWNNFVVDTSPCCGWKWCWMDTNSTRTGAFVWDKCWLWSGCEYMVIPSFCKKMLKMCRWLNSVTQYVYN